MEHLTVGDPVTVKPELFTRSWILLDQPSHQIGWAQKCTRTEVVHPDSRGRPDGPSKLHEQATDSHSIHLLPLPLLIPMAEWNERWIPHDLSTGERSLSLVYREVAQF